MGVPARATTTTNSTTARPWPVRIHRLQGARWTPSHGPPAGGTLVTITGTNFTGATAVSFGTTALTPAATNPPPSGNFTFISDTQIIATSPPGTGVVNVVVTTGGGASSTSATDTFSYGPIVTSINPDTGPATGGTVVTIAGTGFTGASAMDFGTSGLTSTAANPATSGHFTFISDTEIIANSPPGNVPSVTVTVSTPGGTSLGGPNAVFSYGPVVAVIKPDVGVGSGGTKVTIHGLDFKAVTAVDFGTTPADSFTVKSSRRIIAFAPAGTGLVDVTVQSKVGASPKVPTDHFNYAATVTAVRPGHGKAAGRRP
ncbi:MAG TPA: IPT/TIG domain-containing protein [Acidimicrobiales bacterium]|nr:IPT/TIG domain-containing protein [Acidimicrobiales bacterium]